MALAYYGSKLSENIIKTPEGAIIAKNVPIGRTGEMKYYGRELGLDGEKANELITITRDENDVFENEAMASFEGKPVTDDHPPEDVTPANWSIYSRGHVQNVRRGTGEDSDKMIADLFINDAVLAEKVLNKIKRETSSGYGCTYYPLNDGRYAQRQLRGNHVAIVDAGRAGSEVAIRDAKPKETPTKGARKKMNKKSKTSSILNLFARSAKDATADEIEELATDAELALKEIKDEEAQMYPHKVLPAVPGALVAEVETPPSKDCHYITASDVKTMFDEMKKELVEEIKKTDDEKQKDGDPQPGDNMDSKAKDITEGEIEKEDKLEALAKKLIGDEEVKEKVIIEEKSDDALVFDSDEKTEVVVSDKAPILEIIKAARPAIASISNDNERKKVTDALITAIESMTGTGGNGYNSALNTHMANAGALSAGYDAAADTKEYQELQNKYNSFNPHLNK